MSSHPILDDLKDRLSKCIKAFQHDLMKLRTGRASIAMFEGLTVDYYGTITPINQVANFNFSDPRLVVVSPWDFKTIPLIEKAILKSDLGLNPLNDGKVVKIPIPTLTEDRRKELVKVVKKTSEESKIAVRHVRRDAMDVIKKLEKDSELSKDDAKVLSDDVEKHVQNSITEIDRITTHKEEELMKV